MGGSGPPSAPYSLARLTVTLAGWMRLAEKVLRRAGWLGGLGLEWTAPGLPGSPRPKESLPCPPQAGPVGFGAEARALRPFWT